MEINYFNLFLGLLLTCISYMIVPVILKIKNNGYDKDKAKLIALINSVIVGLIFFILTIIFLDGSGVWNAGPACLYYGINCWFLTAKNINVENQVKTRKSKIFKIIGIILAIIIVVGMLISLIGAFFGDTKAVDGNKLRAKHILVSDYETAYEVIALLNENYDFCELVEVYSEDMGTVNNCGDVGYFEENDMVIEFENAVKTLKYNEYTKLPVQSDYGYHIIMRIK